MSKVLSIPVKNRGLLVINEVGISTTLLLLVTMLVTLSPDYYLRCTNYILVNNSKKLVLFDKSSNYTLALQN